MRTTKITITGLAVTALVAVALAGCSTSHPAAVVTGNPTAAPVAVTTPAPTAAAAITSRATLTDAQVAALPATVHAYAMADGTKLAVVDGQPLPDAVTADVVAPVNAAIAAAPTGDGHTTLTPAQALAADAPLKDALDEAASASAATGALSFVALSSSQPFTVSRPPNTITYSSPLRGRGTSAALTNPDAPPP